MSTADPLVRVTSKGDRRRNTLNTIAQRREALAVNRITKFSKSLAYIPITRPFGTDDLSDVRPQLRRCKSEEVLSSWDHFSDSTLNLVPRRRASAQTLTKVVDKQAVNNAPPTDDLPLPDTPTAGGPHQTPSEPTRIRRDTIVLESASEVSAGTVDSLVGHLTDTQYITGTQYTEYFLFTYRYFMTAEGLLEKLKAVYVGTPPTGLSQADMEMHDKLLPMRRLRVINVMKKWVENHVNDFSNNDILSKYLVFLGIIAEDNAKWADHLKKTVENRILKSINDGKASEDMRKWTAKTVKLKDLQALMTIAMLLRRSEIVATRKKNLRTFKHSFYGNEALDWLSQVFHMARGEALNLANQLLHAGFVKHRKEQGNREHTFKDKASLYICNSSLTDNEAEYPKPIRPKTTSFSFLDLHPLEVARQLTLIEFKMFAKISPQELSHQAWGKKNAKDVAPNLMALIERTNEVAYWVATEIVLTPNLKQRISVLARFIAISEICYEFRNWNTLQELLVGMNMGCITRLKKTWEGLPKNATAAFEMLMNITSSSQNYSHYREALASREVPFAPNLAVHLRDLTFIEDGNTDTVDGGLINFTKMHMLGAVFDEIHRLQTTPYHFKEIKAINKFLTQGIFVLKTDKDLYKRSNSCEPSVRTLSMMRGKNQSVSKFGTIRSTLGKTV